MFHQVSIAPRDLSHRFLYAKSRDLEPETYELTVLMFAATSSPFCSQYVLRRNADLWKGQFTAASSAIQISTYMDDFIHGCSGMEEALQLVNEDRKSVV